VRRDFATTFATEAVVIGSYLITFWVVAHTLGTTGFGEYSLSRRTLSLLLPLTVLGMDIGVARYVAIAEARSETGAGYLRPALLVTLSAAAISSLLLLALAPASSGLFFGSPAYVGLIWPLPLLLFGSSLHTVAYGYLRGRSLIQRANLLMAANHAAVPLLAVVVGRGSVVTILTTLGVGWIAVSLAVLVNLPLRPANTRERLRELLRFGVPRVPGDLVQLALFALPAIVVAHLADIRTAGITAFGMAAVGMVGSTLTPISFVLLPVAARLFAQSSGTHLRARILELSGITIGSLAVLIGTVEVLAEPIVRVYLGPSFSSGVPLLRWTLLGAIPWGIHITLRSVLDARYEQAMNARNMVVSFLIFILVAGPAALWVGAVYGVILAFVVALAVLAGLTVAGVLRATAGDQTVPAEIALEPEPKVWE
jgi:O-antigen/teichoic acid export membrane protein